MCFTNARCLILACGNTLREDDGAGPWLAEWARQRFQPEAGVRVLSRQQWTPELAEELARAGSVLFIDSSVDSPPGVVKIVSIEPAAAGQGLATHHLDAAQLLALGRDLYDSLPGNAQLLTIGAGSTELGEEFSGIVKAALPEACRLLEAAVLRLLGGPEPRQPARRG
jgi:hydrogenase maturation protease